MPAAAPTTSSAPSPAAPLTSPASLVPGPRETSAVAEEKTETPLNPVPDAETAPAFEETNVWPTASEEAAFLAETRERGESPSPPVARAETDEADESPKALPKLDDLVNRIPGDVRELLDDLFRAKFTTVRRVKAKNLK